MKKLMLLGMLMGLAACTGSSANKPTAPATAQAPNQTSPEPVLPASKLTFFGKPSQVGKALAFVYEEIPAIELTIFPAGVEADCAKLNRHELGTRAVLFVLSSLDAKLKLGAISDPKNPDPSIDGNGRFDVQPEDGDFDSMYVTNGEVTFTSISDKEVKGKVSMSVEGDRPSVLETSFTAEVCQEATAEISKPATPEKLDERPSPEVSQDGDD